MKSKKRQIKKRVTKVTNTGRKSFPEPKPSTRLDQVRQSLQNLDFGFTIFFADERGQSIKYYQGAVVQEDAR